MHGWQILATISSLITRLFFYYPCEHPVIFHLGSIDSRFKLSQSEAQKDISAATAIWGPQYFRLDPGAKLTVNFVYDQRSGLVTEINSEQNKIDSSKDSLAAKISVFNAKAKTLEQKIAELNTEITKWNSQGGAPEDIYKQLLAQQKDLQTQSQALRQEGIEINQEAKKFNLQVDELNSTINNFNDLLAAKPEEGLFNGPEHRIDIYFVNSRDELVHTLAHEFGHALGMDHVAGSTSIMYSYTSKSLSPTSQDLAELSRACTRINKLQIIDQYLKQVYSQIIKSS